MCFLCLPSDRKWWAASKHQNSPQNFGNFTDYVKSFQSERDTHLGRSPPSGTYSAALKRERDQFCTDRIALGRVGCLSGCSGLYSPSRSSVVLMASAGRSFTDRQGASLVTTSSSKPQRWWEADVKAPVCRCENVFVRSLLLRV